MKWITREKVKVDRVACPWLIKKFIDPEARVLVRACGSGRLLIVGGKGVPCFCSTRSPSQAMSSCLSGNIGSRS